MGADNQQGRLDEQWIAGFVDGEGCFHVSINKIPKMSNGCQVLPEFRVVQHQKDEELLKKLQNHFGFGFVVRNHKTRKEFRVRKLSHLQELIGFFNTYHLQTSKKNDFELFARIVSLMVQKKHLTKTGLQEIARLASMMNRKTPRHLEPSETARRTPNNSEKVQSDPLGD